MYHTLRLYAQEFPDPVESLPAEADALIYKDDELDSNACMLPLVRFIEKASSLSIPGDLLGDSGNGCDKQILPDSGRDLM